MTKQPPLILGKNGQLGRAFSALLPEATSLGREEADLADATDLKAALSHLNPGIVINAAAYTAVDRAEAEPQAAFAVNAEGPRILAEYCAARGIPLVHFSTDYVFDGSGTRPWNEADAPAPLNVYGRSKLAGEEAILAADAKHLIFRTSWVYDAEGKNFLNTMLTLGREKENLSVVADQRGAPTYAPQLAEAALAGLDAALKQREFSSGVYHLCHAGETTWHGFAEAIFSAARAKGAALAVRRVEAIATEDFPRPAPRPKNSRLDCDKAARALGIRLPAWQEGLKACMERKYGS